MKKHTVYSEAAYLIGLVCVAFGVMLMEKANFGIAVLEAPPYLIYRKLSETFDFITFGMAEYCFQALLIIIMMMIVRRMRLGYFFSFVTALLFGFVLDGAMLIGQYIPTAMWARLFCYAAGVPFISFGVSMFFRTYLIPQANELVVMELSSFFHVKISRFKTWYDCGNCICALLLTIIFFGWWPFVGVGWGTIVCACVNGFLIGKISAVFDRHLSFKDALPLRKFFSSI